MFLDLADVLTSPEVERLRAMAANARFVEGRLSNPHSKAKNNLQIDHGDPAYAESMKLMGLALQRSAAFREFAFPRVVAPPLLARYAPGMNYGVHSDAPIMALPTGPLRSDLSCTLFLTEPSAYEGGELSIQLGGRELAFKGAPGSAVIYPSTTLHEVRPVTAGERLVGLTFIESLIRDPTKRDILWHLNELAALEGFNMSWENRTRLQHARNNLMRLWAGDQ
ncbi:MAG TPA: Fe2+-dependent dioxygenase [Caulobacteraceae bacterium]|jgi:PKHD-type hydroxylase